MKTHEASERIVAVNGLEVVVRAWFCTPRGGWLWTARDAEGGGMFSAAGTTHAWKSAEVAHESALATLARVLA